MVYLNKTRLKQHIDCVHTGRYQNNVVNKGLDYIDSIKCSSCYETFSAGNHYIQHHQAVHGGIPPEYIDKEQFMCDQCPNVFMSKQRLTTHKWSVHLNKRKPSQGVQCQHCGKRYKGGQNLKEHVKKDHEKSTPFGKIKS